MEKPNIQEKDQIIFLDEGKEYDGMVLDIYREYIWINVIELTTVFVVHPFNVHELKNGKKFFGVYERKRTYDQIISHDDHHHLSEHIFSKSKKRDLLISKVKLLRVISSK